MHLRTFDTREPLVISSKLPNSGDYSSEVFLSEIINQTRGRRAFELQFNASLFVVCPRAVSSIWLIIIILSAKKQVPSSWQDIQKTIELKGKRKSNFILVLKVRPSCVIATTFRWRARRHRAPWRRHLAYRWRCSNMGRLAVASWKWSH